MKRDQVLRRLEQEWKAFLTSFESLFYGNFFESGVTGEWSVRDVLAHVTTWEEEALKALPLILQGKPLPRYARYGGINAFNTLEQERRRGLSLNQVRQELEATHQRLVTFLSTTPESAYATGSRFLRRLSLDTYNHYREHTGQIALWRKERGL